MAGFTVGGETAWKVRAKGDLGVAFHWVGGEPSLVLYPLHRTFRLTKGVPYCLPLSSAHEVVSEGTHGEGVDASALMAKATRAAEVMGLDTEFSTVSRIADAILESLDDLCDMPPDPAKGQQPADNTPTGELALKVGGETVFETEV